MIGRRSRSRLDKRRTSPSYDFMVISLQTRDHEMHEWGPISYSVVPDKRIARNRKPRITRRKTHLFSGDFVVVVLLKNHEMHERGR